MNPIYQSKPQTLLAVTALALLVMASLGLVACREMPKTGSQTEITPQPSQNQAIATWVTGVAEVSGPNPKPPPGEGWRLLFDGRTLAGWRITDFGGHGETKVENGQLILEMGAALTGVTFTNELPKIDYEVSLEAMKVDGGDFFCGLTMPVMESHCTFVVGGWGGGVVGISSIDGMDASENETTKYLGFAKGRWYRIRARMTRERIECWIDDEKVVDQSIVDRKIGMRLGDIELSAPFGVATWQTTAAIRNLYLRKISPTR